MIFFSAQRWIDLGRDGITSSIETDPREGLMLKTLKFEKPRGSGSEAAELGHQKPVIQLVAPACCISDGLIKSRLLQEPSDQHALRSDYSLHGMKLL